MNHKLRPRFSAALSCDLRPLSSSEIILPLGRLQGIRSPRSADLPASERIYDAARELVGRSKPPLRCRHMPRAEVIEARFGIPFFAGEVGMPETKITLLTKVSVAG
jgi:hypothetical protein